MVCYCSRVVCSMLPLPMIPAQLTSMSIFPNFLVVDSTRLSAMPVLVRSPTVRLISFSGDGDARRHASVTASSLVESRPASESLAPELRELEAPCSIQCRTKAPVMMATFPARFTMPSSCHRCSFLCKATGLDEKVFHGGFINTSWHFVRF
uniref:Putative secreted protein n=1 Tax=Ixodes ricinus TaxID=34613 RepID=A0A090XD00_IXORI